MVLEMLKAGWDTCFDIVTDLMNYSLERIPQIASHAALLLIVLMGKVGL